MLGPEFNLGTSGERSLSFKLPGISFNNILDVIYSIKRIIYSFDFIMLIGVNPNL